MSLKILKCAVIGLGRIGWQYHIPAILHHPGFELSAVVDPLEERLREAQSEFSVKNAFKDCSGLTDVNIDLAVIASPTRFHCGQTCFLLEHGIDVFCDKPMTMNLAEAEEIAAAVRKHKRKFMVYQPHRLAGETRIARRILDSGKLGRAYMVCRSIHSYSRRNDWQAVQEAGGGMLFNYGAHYLDQMLYLFADRCRNAHCELRREISLGNADDVVQILMTGQSGMLYSLDINAASALPVQSMMLYGTMGCAALRADRSWIIRYCPQENMPALSLSVDSAAPDRRYPSEQIPWVEEIVPAEADAPEDFYEKCHAYFARNCQPFVPLEETLEVMRVLEMCRRKQ